MRVHEYASITLRNFYSEINNAYLASPYKMKAKKEEQAQKVQANCQSVLLGMYLGCDKDISLQVDHDAKGRGREHLVGQGLHEWLHRAHLLAVLGDGRNLNNKNRVDVHDVFEYVLDNNNNVNAKRWVLDAEISSSFTSKLSQI